MARLYIKPETIRALFALSGNRCAFPGCNNLLINNKGTLIAQVCHIEAANKGGQRFNPDQSDEERRSLSNLMILCYEHHTETNDEKEFTAERLQEMKKKHEEKFRGTYQLPEQIEAKIFSSIQNELERIAFVSGNTNKVVHGIDDKLDELLRRTAPQASFDEEKYYISQLDSIKALKNKGKYKTAIDLLLDFKAKNWQHLNAEAKYRVYVNLGMCWLDLHEKTKASEQFIALMETGHNSPDSLALRCLGHAIAGEEPEFDRLFEEAKQTSPDNINLWVAYIERHKKYRSSDQLIAEIPASVRESVPVIFTLGNLMIDEGKKEEGLALLEKTLADREELPQKLADTKALIATRIILELNDLLKLLFNSYTDDERHRLDHCRTLLTEAWNEIGGTEQARFKWYIVLNRGVINKLTRRNQEALRDFQIAFEISGELLPFRNLFLMHLQLGNTAEAERLLNDTVFPRPLSEHESEEMQRYRARLLCLQGKFQEGIHILTQHIGPEQKPEDINTIGQIIAIYFENGAFAEAAPWCEEFLKRFPSEPAGYFFSGYLMTKQQDTVQAIEFYDRGALLLTNTTPQNERFNLASGYLDLRLYDKAIGQLEKIADKNILNNFSRSLILAYYKSGDLQAALALAQNLLTKHPDHSFLVEIVSNVHHETRQYDKAIAVIDAFLPLAKVDEKDFFNLKSAHLYSLKRDWPNVLRHACSVQYPEKFSVTDAFDLSGLLLQAGDADKAMLIAFDARTRFFDDSLTHVRYQAICIENKQEAKHLFPSIVRPETAVTVKTETGEEKTFLITDKTVRNESVLKPTDTLAKQLIGKEINMEVTIDKGQGITYRMTIMHIMDIYTFAFQESMRLFETRFAGEHNIGVFQATPGEPGDQLEQVIKSSSIEKNNFERQIFQQYNLRRATLGMLAGVLRRNGVMQWFTMVSSQEVSLLCYSQNERPTIDSVLAENKPVVIDLVALLTLFFVARNTNFLSGLGAEYIVSESTVEQLQEGYEELARSANDGIFSLGYKDGSLVGHTISKETIQRDCQILSDAIQWCRDHARILTPLTLLQVKREQRQRYACVFGQCFYDTLLLAKENNAVILSDDNNFKWLIQPLGPVASFSTYQLAQYLGCTGKIDTPTFEVFTMQLICSNYLFIPLTGGQLWQCFDAAHFQLHKPFIVAVKALIVMTPEFTAGIITDFLKKLYLESGLATTRQQTVLFILGHVSKRRDFPTVKSLLVATVEQEFRLLPTHKNKIVQLANSF